MIITIYFILIAMFFQLNNGMIISQCTEPNQWKIWLNVNRPTALGLFWKITFIMIFICYS
jgi:hypothetical protein